MKISEGYIFKDKTIGINVDLFINRMENKLLIFGYAGSGKTTLGERLSKKLRVKWVSIDSLWWRLKEKHFKDIPNIKEATRHKKVRELVYRTVIKHLQSRERMIIEGVDLLDMYANMPRRYKGMILHKPMVILGTSLIKSSLKAAARNRKREDEGWNAYYWMLQYNIKKVDHNLRVLKRDVKRLPDANIVEYK